MTPTAARTDAPIAAGPGVRVAARTAAWAVWLTLVVASTALGFVAIETVARPEFARRRTASPDTVFPVGRFLTPIPLTDGMVVKQAFEVDRDGLAGIRVQAVTWGTTPDAYEVAWSLQEIGPDGASHRVLRRGTIATERLTDWCFIDIAFDPIADSGGLRYALKFAAGPGRAARLLGLPLFETTVEHSAPIVRAAAETEPRPVPESATLHLKLVHADTGG